MSELLESIGAVQGGSFKVVSTDSLDATGKYQHMIAHHAEAIGNQKSHKLMVIAEPLNPGQLIQMYHGEKALQ